MPSSHKKNAEEQRQQWMRTMALASMEDLEAAYQAAALNPAYRFLRPPESGTLMLRGGINGDGADFNMGETTLTRCTVLLQDGPSGTAYVLGRNHRKAELMALCDALLQDRRYCGRIMLAVIKTLEEKHCKRMEAIRQRISPTKVDFFTMARGE